MLIEVDLFAKKVDYNMAFSIEDYSKKNKPLVHSTKIMCNKREGASSTPMKIKKRSKSIKLHNKRDPENSFFKKG